LFDYQEKKWNNYDLFCLCSGVIKHGHGEWEAVLKDEQIWSQQLKSKEADDEEEDLDDELESKEAKKKSAKVLVNIDDLLLEKMNTEAFSSLKAKGQVKQTLLELVRRRGYNFLNFVFEHFKQLSLPHF
jgi:hypothetical protein